MTIKSALSVVALAAGLVAAPVFAQDMMIGTQTVLEADVEAVKARCVELQTAASTGTESTAETATTTETAPADADAGDDDGDAEESSGDSTVDTGESLLNFDVITLEDCEAGTWLE
ncbi:hypothetical protein [Devosia sediminis]|uniref:Uncharacterized protein n=1 Tax=Devosia sediminis TaxID=2798801 RepID=A0A934IWV1_9HYPH|nr:hypothetical protein [Devosia sediminis]MBJ3783695.1 hypothetical protein [Devosia sediminis]